MQLSWKSNHPDRRPCAPAGFLRGRHLRAAGPAVTVYEVAMHLEYLSRPKLQIRVIRILWMVPIYAVDRYRTIFCGIRYISWLIHYDQHQPVGPPAESVALHAVRKLACSEPHTMHHQWAPRA